MKKTQKEKMLSGEYYNASDSVLLAERNAAKQLTHAFNMSDPADFAQRDALLRQLLGDVGEGVVIEASFRCDYGYNISIGNDVFINFDCVMLDTCSISVGNNVFMGPGVHIYTALHPLEAAPRIACLENGKSVLIGDNVWIGGRAVINPGVTVGKNAVVASGSVVTRDVPENALVAGVPAKIIKMIVND